MIDTALEPGSTSTERDNEDMIGMALDEDSGAVWVLDGTSGFFDQTLEGEASDGRWYVEQFTRALSQDDRISDLEEDVEKIICDAVDEVRNEYSTRVENKAETQIISNAIGAVDELGSENPRVGRMETPSSKIGIVRWNEGKVETYNLGDCLNLVKTTEGVEEIFHGGPDKADRKVTAAMSKMHQSGEGSQEYFEKLNQEYDVDLTNRQVQKMVDTGFTHEEVMGGDNPANQMVYAMLEQHRAGKNAGLYQTLGFDSESIQDGELEVYNRSQVEAVAMMSDGVSPAIQDIDLFSSESLMDYLHDEAKGQDIQHLVAQVRSYLQLDSNAEEIPRFKTYDDAAAAYIEL